MGGLLTVISVDEMQLVLVDSNFIRAVMRILQTEEQLPGVEIAKRHHNFSATLRSQSISYQCTRCIGWRRE
ncbi:hypothetical protein TNCV_4407691 [Trichonephila clavipes]|nr:hypothetical protein TNCV_4407691 [Trichonephila clavipes]